MGMIAYFATLGEDDVQRLRDGDESLLEELYEEEQHEVTDIDKAWHGVHFLLSGEPHGPGERVEGAAIMGGTEVGPDMGYGSGRVHTPSQVQEINVALDALSEDTFCDRFDATELGNNDIYPDIWDEGEEALEYLMFGLQGIKQVFATAALRDEYVFTWIG